MAKKLTSTKAKKILHDKTVHGKPLTDKQRKFFGAVASGAIPQAQNGIEGTMGGLTDIGFNYNGAWGGTMQMGGGLPGAVGFTYARTAGAAPANGPYAKKTKASAQDGVKKPLVKLSPDELKMERLKQYAQRASKKEQPTVQPRGSMSDAARKQLYEDAQRSELKNQFLRIADVATDLMQFGNFVPNPVGQAIGTAGNILGGWVDSYQAYDAYNKGNYGDAAINAASVALPMGLGSSTFRRNSKYLKPGQPLYPLSPQANLPASSINAPRVNYIEPFTKVKGMTDANLLANRALLGTLGAETAYDTFQNGGSMKYYQAGLDFKPKTISQDGTYVKKPRTDMLTMDEYRLQQAIANQPVVQPALKIGQLSEEEIKRRNKAYAQQTGKKFDEKTGKVSPRFSPQQEKTLKKVEENIVAPALTVADIMAGAALAKPLTKAVGKKALSTFVDLERLPSIPRNTRVNTIREFSNQLSQYERSAGIDRDDYRGDLMERFQDIGNRFNIDVSASGATEQIKNLSKADKSEFLTSILRSFPQRLRRSDFAPIERSFFTRGVEITPDDISYIPRGLTNKSGLTKQQVLEKAPVKDKDIVSKMTDKEFMETVVKPTGEVVPYYTGDLIPQFTGKQNVMAISHDEYAKRFNENIETLNEIIAKRNKSGVQYRVKDLTPSGRLTFETTAQEGVPGGETYWTTNINPGTWEGEVEDIASATYYKSIPGLSMSSSSAGVFPDRIPRRGTAAYESINEYLKQLNLGRVKPGFNSQTEYSRGLWENAVNKGKAFGYYNNPRVVYGSMKSLLPYAGLGAIGAGAIEQKREGGEITVDPMGYWNPDNIGEPVIIPSNEITMQGVYQPLIGISDTGDVQYMEPGEDYIFDGEYVTEYPMAKGGISVNEADAQPIKKLDQLLNFTNYNDMAKAKKGKKLPKAQGGFEQAIGNIDSSLGNMGGISGASTQLLGGIQTLIEEGKQRKKTQQALALSDITAKAATTRPVGLERRYVRPEDMLVDPGQIASPYGTGLDFLQMEDGGFIGGNPTEIQNMYNPGDLYSDLGYEPLNDSNKVKQFKEGGKAFYGMETTNTTTTAFPFGSMNPASFGQLGNIAGSAIGGGGGQQSGAGQVGSAVGSVAGNLILPGVGGVIGGALGGLVGGLIGAPGQKRMEQKQRRIQGNLGSAALQQSLQGQFSGFMEHGGELKYLSHTWQPQTITKFGDYDVKDLLAPPKDADMLRAGGHLKAYTPPSEAAMSTERPMMQMGGELQTYWGGYAEPISYNPYLPDGGETVMFRGQSHDESDGKGRTGIGITFGQSPVEVERGEPAVKLKDGGTGDNSLVVFGNMQIPSYGASELGDPKAKGMKFKRYAEDLSKIETKANKTSDKALKILDSTDGSSPFDMLAMSTANVMMKGSDMKLKEAAMKKQLAAGIQSAILDTAEEMGIENDALAKGKIKAAKGGGKFTSAQVGIELPTYTNAMINKFGPFYKPVEEMPVEKMVVKGKNSKPSTKKTSSTPAPVKGPIKIDMTPFMPTAAQLAAEDAAFRAANPEQPSTYIAPNIFDSLVGSEGPSSGRPIIETKQPKDKSGFRLTDLARDLNPYIRPLIQNRLDPAQFAPEMMALATNVVEPVQAQQFMPMLEEVPTISLQDQLNEIQAEANAARRLAGNNPAAQAAIAAQAAAAKNKVLGEETRMNRMLQLESRRKNLATLNQATLTNLDILGQQYERQARAKSITKAQAQEALQSIAEKIARNKAETLEANVRSNMYPQYTFGPKGRIFNTGLTTYNIPNISDYTVEEIQKIMDAKKIEESKGKSSEKKRNGSIVKAIKNL